MVPHASFHMLINPACNMTSEWALELCTKPQPVYFLALFAAVIDVPPVNVVRCYLRLPPLSSLVVCSESANHKH